MIEIKELDKDTYLNKKFTVRYQTKGYYDIHPSNLGFEIKYEMFEKEKEMSFDDSNRHKGTGTFLMLTCAEINTVVFTHSWHGGRKDIYDSVIKQLKNDGIEFKESIIILKCSEAENIRRAVEDNRDEKRIERGIKNTFSFYNEFDYPCVDTTSMGTNEVVEQILKIVD